MIDLFQQFRKLNIDTSLISLEWQDEIYPYFCYPLNAKAIGFEGSIMYCFIEGYGDMVFASNPETCIDINVYPLARSFKDFLRLIITCGSANPIEQIVWMSEEQFFQHLQQEQTLITEQQKGILQLLSQQFNLLPMEDPFGYVKGVQKNFDDSKIKYSDEYYDVLGLENPNGTPCFEFEPVVFTFEKK